MRRKKLIVLGSIIVITFGLLTVIANYPKIYSPYSFTVVIPIIFLEKYQLNQYLWLLLGAMPVVILYLFWSLIFIKDTWKISKPSILLAIIMIISSIVFHAVSFEYGIQYQGILHTLVMCLYTLSTIGILTIIVKKNIYQPTIKTCLSFHIILFSWLGWTALPWLGEMI